MESSDDDSTGLEDEEYYPILQDMTGITWKKYICIMELITDLEGNRTPNAVCMSSRGVTKSQEAGITNVLAKNTSVKRLKTETSDNHT